MTDMERNRFRELMMKSLDGELVEREQIEFDTLLQNSEYRSELEEYLHIKEATMALKIKSPAPEVWDGYWDGVYNRMERGIAWLLVSIGAVLLLAWAAIEAASALWADSELPLFIKLAVGALCAGLLLLLYSVIRERWFMAKTDKYKGVVR